MAETANTGTTAKDAFFGQLTHEGASEFAKQTRRLLEKNLPPSVLKILGKTGVAEAISFVTAFVLRLVLGKTVSDPKARALAQNAVTEFLNELGDIGENTQGVKRKKNMADESSAADSAFVPSPAEYQEKIFMLLRISRKLVQEYGRFIERFLAKYGEEETEEFLKWLNTLEREELEGFMVLDESSKFAYWDAKEHPLEKQRLRDKAKKMLSALLSEMKQEYQRFKDACEKDIVRQSSELEKLAKERGKGVPWLKRLNPFTF